MRKGCAILILLFFVLLFQACKEPYFPAIIEAPNSYLVVDGMIKVGGDSTIIRLTRTRNLKDSAAVVTEEGAFVVLEGNQGGYFPLTRLGNGYYGSAPLNLSVNEKYSLKIITRENKQYQSDLIPVKPTPPIDSVSWVRDSSVTVRVTTHDPTGNSRFYRWEFEETWEYTSYYESILGYDYGTNQPFYLNPKDYLNRCWSSEKSSSILLASTNAQVEDVVENLPITTIAQGSDKASVRYSILVKQYALTKEAFEYWQLLRKNTNELGSIFGNQPAELISNIKCVSNLGEPVIGFISISSIQQKRLFIRRGELSGWTPDYSLQQLCEPKIVGPDSLSFYLQRNRNLMQAYNITGGGTALADKRCIDCRLRGGTTKMPSYW
jgi:hypothetical protein